MYQCINKCDVTVFFVLSFMRSWLVDEESCGSCQNLVNQTFVELLCSVLKTSASGLPAYYYYYYFFKYLWTLLLVVSLLLFRDFGTLFHWTVELLHPLTHLRSVSRHFSLIRHNRTVARASVLWRDINWSIDWLIERDRATTAWNSFG